MFEWRGRREPNRRWGQVGYIVDPDRATTSISLARLVTLLYGEYTHKNWRGLLASLIFEVQEGAEARFVLDMKEVPAISRMRDFRIGVRAYIIRVFSTMGVGSMSRAEAWAARWIRWARDCETSQQI